MHVIHFWRVGTTFILALLQSSQKLTSLIDRELWKCLRFSLESSKRLIMPSQTQNRESNNTNSHLRLFQHLWQANGFTKNGVHRLPRIGNIFDI